MVDPKSRPRLLLRRLHSVMAGEGTAEKRLNGVVDEIARTMVAEVCSVYLMRGGWMLELFATRGLKPEAVHETRLRVGEGLVGLIAERGLALNLPEASQHPKFVYRPETGEEKFHSLLGVPIIRNNKVVGVLVIQNAEPRHYTGEEVEVLQTIAMVLAELIESGELLSPAEMEGDPDMLKQPVSFTGQKLSEGLARGVIVLHEPKIRISRLVSENTEKELSRFEGAIITLREELDRMMVTSDMDDHGAEYREVLEAYKMFAADRGWQDKIRDAVESGLTAEAAVERVQQDMRVQMARTNDPYLRESLGDLEDLSNRLIRVLLGYSGAHAHTALTEPSIVLARSIGPAELLDYERKHLRGLLLEEGSPTSHATIVARALGIPVLGHIKGQLSLVREGDAAIIDAEAGRALIRPSEDAQKTYDASLSTRKRLAREYKAQRDLPAVTKDNVRINLMINAGLIIDLPTLEETGAEGIGLFRTEFQFMVSSTLPRLDVQTELYKKVLDAAGDRPVVFRALDLGGDKRVPFLEHPAEENPAMGWRAMRLTLERPALLRYQLRALLAAAAGRDLNIMFPMISEVGEFLAARKIVDAEVKRLERLGRTLPRDIRVGSMVEVPALAWQTGLMLKHADFLSIGTNDLMQFFFASDRGNPKLSDRYDLLSPAALSFIRMITEDCEKAGKPVTVCGEMGSRPLDALALIAIGVRRLSMSPPAIGPIRRLVRAIDLSHLEAELIPRLESGEHSLRGWLQHYMDAQKLPA